jgi:branched-subunit amino acid permease
MKFSLKSVIYLSIPVLRLWYSSLLRVIAVSLNCWNKKIYFTKNRKYINGYCHVEEEVGTPDGG